MAATPSAAATEEDGLHAGAILLLALGEDCAADVFRHLTPKEVQRLGERMARLTTVADAQFDEVLARFHGSVDSQRSLVSDTGAYVSNVLKLALGEDKAGLLIDRIVQGRDVSGIESLKWMDASAIAELIRNEHPQIVASILVHLDRDHASGVLSAFDERLRNDVLLRIATLDGIQPNALKELNDVLSKVLAGGDRVRKAPLGGTKTAAEILNFLGAGVEAAALAAIRAGDPDLAQKIEEQMFTFADLLKLDNKSMQRLLREVGGDTLVVALKGAEPEMREKVFANMSTRAAETLREDLESKGPVRLSDVEAQQKEILKLARRLADEREIMIGGGGDESFV
ncbi:flagellar motor switch protein FliG [Ramlibacter alkalitolerans]|uniref:Flagellar motor switch protein FliG n=1 Tax=Ramlibacter alkalitolerans TaxID=2039631 RepID=A0ABS1JL14_9BURK|nr:flagellar motor switch protein FliG [Ramlibacter alkalitolerans]MBL0424884.1 flagellar motor switch protein FliG [Ramlibacter alkalitolerans]